MIQWPPIVARVFNELTLLASSRPNERLPKEEQVRSCIYAALASSGTLVVIERGYKPVESGDTFEADLWFKLPAEPEHWIEMKRAWSFKGSNRKPPEQLADWQRDADKLRNADVNTDRSFVLVGVFDCDPAAAAGNSDPVLANIELFFPTNRVFRAAQQFWWRNECVTHLGLWVWHWPVGVPVQSA